MNEPSYISYKIMKNIMSTEKDIMPLRKKNNQFNKEYCAKSNKELNIIVNRTLT